ncbi:transcriptional regulator [Escherichia coli]|uniref:adhesin biosynthesis transcription regulatory family protein n=1 Tax=Escherichia coli TaxID=562 RepID=UPI001302DEC3|nr:adhesin biosynthesis transcription regulatory family protein [Escherichia coli]EJZ3074357.1 adhesin biosynthesis transcription regulatory family protein [Escherichia coli]KAE9821785.1 transcriptional regulator [Escherichia coli]MDS1689738.1 adhesin biosynthesis transcription regulatory family protein [Escherichia coli]MWK18056.1 transcriptional regulator [Escherichia coli]MWK86113.1 transcriptional regulator [Escherichia coli]
MNGINVDKEERLFAFRASNVTIMPGNMPEVQFWLLVEISPIHSEKMISALREFLVHGYSRKDICRKYNISSGYFSSALGRFQRVVFTVMQLMPYYVQESESMTE